MEKSSKQCERKIKFPYCVLHHIRPKKGKDKPKKGNVISVDKPAWQVFREEYTQFMDTTYVKLYRNQQPTGAKQFVSFVSTPVGFCLWNPAHNYRILKEKYMSIPPKFKSQQEAHKAGWFSRRHETNKELEESRAWRKNKKWPKERHLWKLPIRLSNGIVRRGS